MILVYIFCMIIECYGYYVYNSKWKIDILIKINNLFINICIFYLILLAIDIHINDQKNI